MSRMMRCEVEEGMGVTWPLKQTHTHKITGNALQLREKSHNYEKHATIVRYKVTTVSNKVTNVRNKEIISKFWRNKVAIRRKKSHNCEKHACYDFQKSSHM